MHDAVTTIAKARADLGSYDLSLLPETLEQGYAFQDALAMSLGAIGGFKLAVNGAAQMAHFGVSTPISARVLCAQVHRSGAEVARAAFQTISVEPQIAAILGDGVETLTGPVTREQAASLIERFHPAIELIDQRGLSVPQLQLPQVVALNVFNAGVVLGDDHIAPADLDLARMHVSIHDDGALMDEATGTAPQDPVEAVMRLLNQLSARGVALRAGMVVMCGTHLALRTLDPSVTKVDVTMSGLGSVSFTIR